jgi:hypothetical protein
MVWREETEHYEQQKALFEIEWKRKVSQTILLMKQLFFCALKRYNFKKVSKFLKKSFMRLTPGPNVIKLFTAVIYKRL